MWVSRRGAEEASEWRRLGRKGKWWELKRQERRQDFRSRLYIILFNADTSEHNTALSCVLTAENIEPLAAFL